MTVNARFPAPLYSYIDRHPNGPGEVPPTRLTIGSNTEAGTPLITEVANASIRSKATLGDRAIAPNVATTGGVPKTVVEVGPLVIGTPLGFPIHNLFTGYLTLAWR